MTYEIIKSPLAGPGNLRYAVCKNTGIAEAEERRVGEQNAHAEDPVMRRDLTLPDAVQIAGGMGCNVGDLIIVGYDARIDDSNYRG
ncbi:hypothetical protein COY59_01090 [Candidatus Gottesmanbacteria bacterium CG_4_10_14_0_8_um_filter_37_24]|uniref:Uncharacterized protein n=1 Tax=Candidatus Gottesmanbacteria bacterium CG_4_10_14_0_8_um_filter_37_24 TaxID=1974574 RepID=A0A2M7RS93_9BACT|nr:MAG: hypothetical protein COX23_01470 [Candidatus Gottesmanbacteria bacterium CG23_combo_of_CG06-09_8_20_14_all_37_19]PIZ03136.1 MAG: hypothetical protein COY59_01090 [Candidatus Gottesmanbacteria bacterium CG_4_10_14_0_8_um_filter_37_24]